MNIDGEEQKPFFEAPSEKKQIAPSEKKTKEEADTKEEETCPPSHTIRNERRRAGPVEAARRWRTTGAMVGVEW